MKVRAGDMHDSVEVVQFLIKRFHAEFADRLAPVNPLRAHDYVLRHLKDGIVLIAEMDDRIAGVALAAPQRFWWSDAEHLVEGALYVAPEARRSSAAMRLIRGLQRAARGHGLPLTIANITGVEVDRKRALFERAGLACIGTIHHGV